MPLTMIKSGSGGGAGGGASRYVTVFGSLGLMPTPPAQDISLNDNGWRLRIPVAALTTIPSGVSKIKLSFVSGTTEGMSLANVFVGHAAASGNAWDAAAMTTVAFSGGSAGFSIAAATEITSDEIIFGYNGTSDLIVSMYWNSAAADHGGRAGSTNDGNMVSYSKSNSDITETNGLTPAGFALAVNSDRPRFLTRIQMYGTPSGAFVPLFNSTLPFSTAFVHAGNTRTFRAVIPFKFLENTGLVLPTRVKVRLAGRNSGTEGLNIVKCYIGHKAGAGDPYDAADLTQVLFGGVAGVLIAVNTSVDSDVATWSYNGTSDIVVSGYITDTANDTIGSNTSDLTFYISGTGIDQAATLDASTGYLDSASLGVVKQVLIAPAA